MGLESIMLFNKNIIGKIKKYHPEGGLDLTTVFNLGLMSFSRHSVRIHTENVALMAELVASEMKKDKKAAFFAGLMHDIGKITLPNYLFDGRNVTAEEYAEVKKHTIISYLNYFASGEAHLFTAYCVGLHHALYENGYGLTIQDFPSYWHPKTVKKVLEIANIIAVCDDIEASLTKNAEIKGNDDFLGASLEERLTIKFFDNLQIIEPAMKAAEKIIKK